MHLGWQRPSGQPADPKRLRIGENPHNWGGNWSGLCGTFRPHVALGPDFPVRFIVPALRHSVTDDSPALRAPARAAGNATLAAVEIIESARRDVSARYREVMLRGLLRAAAERKFAVETYRVHGTPQSLHRLDSALQARGIRGLVILPASSPPDLSLLDWSHFSGVYTDCLTEPLPLASIRPDRYRSMVALLARLARLGYRRPGLVLAGDDDLRRDWEGGLLAYHLQCARLEAAVPVLKLGALDFKEFARWFSGHKPDVVISLHAEVMPWIALAGGAVPERHGFVNLNVLGSAVPCAGLDLQPEAIGAGAIDLLIPLLAGDEPGWPGTVSSTAIPARWLDGPTVVRHRPSPVLPCYGHEPALRHPRRRTHSVENPH